MPEGSSRAYSPDRRALKGAASCIAVMAFCRNPDSHQAEGIGQSMMSRTRFALPGTVDAGSSDKSLKICFSAVAGRQDRSLACRWAAPSRLFF